MSSSVIPSFASRSFFYGALDVVARHRIAASAEDGGADGGRSGITVCVFDGGRYFARVHGKDLALLGVGRCLLVFYLRKLVMA